MRRRAGSSPRLEGVDEHQQRERALLVDLRSQKLLDLGKWGAAAFAAHGANAGHLDADEPIAFAVLAGPGLEEALEDRDVGRVRVRTQLRVMAVAVSGSGTRAGYRS